MQNLSMADYSITRTILQFILFRVRCLSKHDIIVISYYKRVITYYPTLADCYVFNVLATYHWPLKLTYMHVHRSHHWCDHDCSNEKCYWAMMEVWHSWQIVVFPKHTNSIWNIGMRHHFLFPIPNTTVPFNFPNFGTIYSLRILDSCSPQAIGWCTLHPNYNSAGCFRSRIHSEMLSRLMALRLSGYDVFADCAATFTSWRCLRRRDALGFVLRRSRLES